MPSLFVKSYQGSHNADDEDGHRRDHNIVGDRRRGNVTSWRGRLIDSNYINSRVLFCEILALKSLSTNKIVTSVVERVTFLCILRLSPHGTNLLLKPIIFLMSADEDNVAALDDFD